MAMLRRAEAKTHPSAQCPVSKADDICLNNGDKAQRKQSKETDDDENNEERDLYQESIDEHYVCNIAMMRIGEERELATSRDAMPGNELEIDRQEEEQTISELVRASSTGAMLEA